MDDLIKNDPQAQDTASEWIEDFLKHAYKREFMEYSDFILGICSFIK